MDLRYRDDEEAFRQELRGWLAEQLPAEWGDSRFWGALDDDAAFALRRRWESAKAAAGFAGIEWPEEYGGRGGTPGMKAIYDEELARAGAPPTVNPLGLAFLGPTVMAIGTEQQKQEIIAPLLRCDVIWCQGFSEPDAGSDLAAVRTRAVDAGDFWVVDGQKVWTSNARHGDRMFALVRTSQEESRHRGLSMLLLDMRAPGVDVRPLTQLSGAEDFGEVFFTGVRVPKTDVLGEVGRGWQVAMLLLSFERGASAIGQYTTFRRELDSVMALARANGRANDPVVRQRIAALVTELELLRLHSLHVLTQVEQGRDLGAESSVTKLQWSETHQDLGELYADVAGYEHQLGDPAAPLGLDPLQLSFLWSRSETIWGGSSQVQRSIVAERVLGLPRPSSR